MLSADGLKASLNPWAFGFQVHGWLFSFIRVHSPAKLCRAPLPEKSCLPVPKFVNKSGVEWVECVGTVMNCEKTLRVIS